MNGNGDRQFWPEYLPRGKGANHGWGIPEARENRKCLLYRIQLPDAVYVCRTTEGKGGEGSGESVSCASSADGAGCGSRRSECWRTGEPTFLPSTGGMRMTGSH